MSFLSDEDLLLVKYMIISMGVIDKNKAKDIKDLNEMFNYLKENYDENLNKNLICEALYHVNCFNTLHTINDCPNKYEGNEWGIDIPDEMILFVRLFQELNREEFEDLLKSCVNVIFDDFLSLEFDINDINLTKIEKIISWLECHENSFAKNVKEMLNSRLTSSNNLIIKENGSKSDNGICLVISNETFKTSAPRIGTEIDVTNIETTFKSLGYQVEIHRNVLSNEMNNIFDHLKDEVVSTHRMIIVFILSHGIEDNIICTDEIMFPFVKIWEPFININFKKFLGKPKLFFFTCCQGSSENEAVESNIEYDEPSKRKIPNISDFFFGYATYKSFVSCRNQKKGTFYVKCLCEVIRDNSKTSIADIHQEVQLRLSLKEIKVKATTSIQMPYYENLLREPAYFISDE